MSADYSNKPMPFSQEMDEVERRGVREQLADE